MFELLFLKSINVEGSNLKLANAGLSLSPSYPSERQIASVCRIVRAVWIFATRFRRIFVSSFKIPKGRTNAARLIFRPSRSSHGTPKLHWLPMEQRINYKLSLLFFVRSRPDNNRTGWLGVKHQNIYSVLHKISSYRKSVVYLSELLRLYTPPRQLRPRADTRVFTHHPSALSLHMVSAFSSYWLTWNQLLVSVRRAFSVSSFNSFSSKPIFTNIFFSFFGVCVCVCVRTCDECVRALKYSSF